MENDNRTEQISESFENDTSDGVDIKFALGISTLISVVCLAIPFFFLFGLAVLPFLPLSIALFFIIIYEADRILHKQMRTNEKITARLEAERKEHQIQYDELCKKLDELEKQLQSKE